jgi:hypothetical protein
MVLQDRHESKPERETAPHIQRQVVPKMNNPRRNLLQTLEYPRAGTDPSEIFFEKEKVIGTPVKVLRTGQSEADGGWQITEIYYRSPARSIKQAYVKVLKPNRDDARRGLQKIIPLRSLEEINPEIKLLSFESEKDYVLYEDREHGFKIGLIIDIDREEETLLIMLGPDGDDITAPLDRIKMTDVIDKSTDPLKLEKTFHEKVKKHGGGTSAPEARHAKRRVGERKNLIYYLKVTDTKSSQPIGHAVDISNQGFMLTAGKSIDPQVVFQLRLLLPTEMNGSWHFGFSAVSRWCQPDENPDYYNVGFQFAEITPAGARIISQLIESYCF